MGSIPVAFIIMVFVSVFLLAHAFISPVFGPERQAARRLRRRLKDAALSRGSASAAVRLREKYFHDLSPLERQLESLPGMESLGQLAEQSGRRIPAYRVVLVSLGLGIVGFSLVWSFYHNPVAATATALGAMLLPILKLRSDRKKQLDKFEEQLPEALDIMVRALKAGHPFSGAVQLVGDEMADPVAREFRITFADINYGLDVKQAFLNLLERVPNTTLMTLVTAVVVQKETGGNLAETLSNISSVVRGRFRFNRRVRTLSAEGRLSAWILALVPFVLFVMIMVTTPSYLEILLQEPSGHKIIAVAFTLQVVGIFWLSRLLRIDV